MRVFALPDFGTEPTLLDVPTPEPGPGEVLVRVHATSLNGFDLSVGASRLEGMMEHRFPVVLGKDFAGTVEAVGARCGAGTVCGGCHEAVAETIIDEVTRAETALPTTH